jgi:hypothetical protein
MVNSKVVESKTADSKMVTSKVVESKTVEGNELKAKAKEREFILPPVGTGQATIDGKAGR